jgi:diguanylate cyclase (GGDEF)-like protein
VKDEVKHLRLTAGTMASKKPAPSSYVSPATPLQQETLPLPSAAAPLKVLIVEDDKDTQVLMGHVVKGMGYDVSAASSGREALQLVRALPPDIVLLDIMMPEMDGFEFCRVLQAEDTLRDFHIIITSARDALEDKVRGLELGAADYLTKPFSLTELKARIQVGERMVRYRKALKEQQLLLEHLAREDKLTGLYNRRHFEERLQEECVRAYRYHRPLSLLLGDIDHFKQVNDHYGHAAGDTVLREVSQTLLRHSRKSDVVARYGGEEFTILLCETGTEEALTAAERLRTAVKALTFPQPSGRVQITMSFGITSLANEQPQNPTQLLEEADKALYAAKTRGRDRVERFLADLRASRVEDVERKA